MSPTPRLAILTDFPDEQWPSMDLCGDMLLAHLPQVGPYALMSDRVCPSFRKLATKLPLIPGRHSAFNVDRLINRFVLFPRHARGATPRFDLFHVVDHTYAQLVHSLPARRTGVFCHDLDHFRNQFDEIADPRPRWFRALSRHILTGLQKAAIVFHSTTAIREEIIRAGLIPQERLVHAPYGVAPEFAAVSRGERVELPWLTELGGCPWVVHVGSCIARKRIDVLLDVVAAVRETFPKLRLVKVGGEWTTEQQKQISRLGLAEAIFHICGLTRTELAEVYRKAPLVLVPSGAEGFGLPVIEALACGAPVLASDIPSLREAGGTAATYVSVGDVEAWSQAITKVLNNPSIAPPMVERFAWAEKFSWEAHAEIIAKAYRRLL